MPGKISVNGTSQEWKDLVVFDILRDSRCAEWRKELLAHDFLFMGMVGPLYSRRSLRLPHLDHGKLAVLNSLGSPAGF